MNRTAFPGAQPSIAAPTLSEAIERLGRATVLVVGDVMLDRYVYGKVLRINPEAPVPILSEDRELALPGGAGNVVRNLTALGVAVVFISVVGDDQPGSDLTGLIGGQPNIEPWLLVEGGRTTTVKTRYIAAGQQLLRADREQTTGIDERLAERVLRIARDAMAATAVTVLSDYRKGMLAGDLPAQLIAAAHQAGRKVVVDPAGGMLARYAGADLIVPSRQELADATGLPLESDDAIAAAADSLRRCHGFGAVLVNRDAAGMTLCDEAGARHFPATPSARADTSGACDTMVATLAAGVAAKLALDDAARLAALAAGLAHEKAGTAVVLPEEMLAVLTRIPTPG